VLDLSRIEAGYLDLKMGPVVCSEVIEEAIDLISPLAEKRNIPLRFENTLPEDEMLYADSTRVKEVLLNLLSNAVKYNVDSGTIIVSTEKVSNGRIRISITDTGKGLPEDKLGGLFQPFERMGAEYSDVEGTGIGLVISKRIVEMMGGNIGAECILGKGCVFWFELDIAGDVKDVANIQHTPEERTNTAGLGNPNNKVLYVEDNPANLKLIERIFQKHTNVSFLSAMTSEMGLELAIAHRPGLILLDINLPGMSGIELLKKIRCNDALRHAKVVALSANSMPQDISDALDAGFDSYMTKPIDISKFVADLPDLLAS